MKKETKMVTTVTQSISVETTEIEKQDTVTILVGDRKIPISVGADLKAHFTDQIYRQNPSALQKKKFYTVMNLMAAAYQQGKRDAGAK